MSKKLRSVGDLMGAELPATMPAEGASLASPPASAAPVPVPAPVSAGSPPAKLTENDDRLTVMLPVDVVDEIKLRAVKERTTIRVIVLRALKAGGFDVPEDELIDRRVEANARRR